MRIRLAENFRAVFYAPFYATQALGFYAREGVDVELIASSGPGDGVSALLGGTVDLTWGGPMRVMKARDQEPASPLVCFGEVVARDPFCLVGRSPRREFRLADLPGLRFAAVSEVPTPWMCLQHDLREQGVDPAGLDRARDRPMAGNFEALRDRRLDAIQVFEPFVSMAQAEGIGDVLYAAAARGPTAYTTFIVTRNGIARHRAAFAAVTRAVLQMQGWLAEHGAEELAEVTARFPDIARDILTSALRRYHRAGLWTLTPDVSRQGFARLAESLLSGGYISRMPAYEDCVEQDLG
ncbi:MAG TPA: ABC transporter substrate-binding protein [Xanthobacteraceae bacterium]|nr:ABC transporter substrate-binding protein [Xanthobacteraceae bacterium]